MADDRERSQVKLLTDALTGVAVWPPTWDGADESMEYLYREHTVLVREADASRVLVELPAALQRAQGVDPAARRVGGEVRRDASVEFPVAPAPRRGESSGGVVPLTWAGAVGDADRLKVPYVLDELDAVLGVGVARPEHVLYVCGYSCPAHEPLEVAAGTSIPTRAFPSPGGDFCHDPKRGSGKGVKISIVDTGLYQKATGRHSWMSGVTGADDGGADGLTIAAYGGHGTFGAGCARVVAPAADVFVASALPYAGADYETNIVRAIHQLLDDGVPDILVFTFVTDTRLSLGLLAFDLLYEERLSQVKGLALLAPAGNDYSTKPKWPAAYPWVTSVGALDANCDRLADYSNRGPWVDVSGPGTDLVNAFPDGAYRCTEPGNNGELRQFTGMGRWSGTSFSTPTVAGMVAARASVTGVTAAVALQQLLAEARTDSVCGVGPVLVPGYRGCGGHGCGRRCGRHGCGGCGCC